jgi:hypothetical protein
MRYAKLHSTPLKNMHGIQFSLQFLQNAVTFQGRHFKSSFGGTSGIIEVNGNCEI